MQEHKYPIKSWAKDDRPREKLLEKGPESLSNSELLAILIRHGTAERSALDLARDILALCHNNLTGLGRLSLSELTAIKGMGSAKAIAIAAAMELGRRRQMAVLPEKTAIRSSSDIIHYLQARLQDYRHEVFAVFYLNRANKVNLFEIISEGGITGTVADPRIIFRKAVEQDAVSIIIAHNHPSGNLQPSRADESLTQKIKEAGALLDIKLVDHIIVGGQGYFSFSDSGLL